jgi:hypothetical protein
MNMKLGRDHREISDAEIERDVAELRRLLAGVEGPKEPHPAYWQNFVVRVRGRLDKEGFRKRRSFSPAWATVGAAALVAVVAVSSLFSPKEVGVTPPQVAGTSKVVPPASSNLAAAYDQSGTQSLILSENDVKMVKAIESNNDDAMFEALAESEQL